MSNEIIEIVKSFEIVCQEDANKASELRRQLKALEAEIRASFDPIVEQAYKAHKEAIAQRDEHLKPVLEAQKRLNSLLADWQEKVEAEARKKMAEELERRRKEEEEKRLAEAEMLAKNGFQDIAEKKLEEPIVVSVNIEAPKTEGVNFAEIWDFEIIDIREIPREYLTPDYAKIRAMVRATKGTLEIPGVKIFKKKIVRGS